MYIVCFNPYIFPAETGSVIGSIIMPPPHNALCGNALHTLPLQNRILFRKFVAGDLLENVQLRKPKPDHRYCIWNKSFVAGDTIDEQTYI
jgi:hypothetical protein